MSLEKVLFTNVAYGDIYASLFCNHHLKSFLDESNIPAYRDRIEYCIFSDKETLPKIAENENYLQLKELVPTELFELAWPEGNYDKFNERYGILLQTFKISIQKALEKNCRVSPIVADLVCARDFIPKILSKVDEGYGAVFVQPPRCGADVVAAELDKYPGAMHAEDLWRLCYDNTHPLWVACHWNAAQFTKLPFQLLWNSYRGGILCHSFSITPLAFKPKKEMLERRGMIDGDIPELCENPYWATDWTDAPIVGVEPVFCYFPPWANHVATTGWVQRWARASLHPSQFEIIKKPLYYPNKELCGITPEVEQAAENIVKAIVG